MTPFNRREILSLGAALALTTGSARSAEKWIEGKHYFRVESPPAPTAGTVTVTEIFSYGCPACNDFLPFMQSLEKKLAGAAVVEYLHASWIAAEDWPVLQRAHITAKALGIEKKTHEAMFSAIWKTGELAVTDPRTGRPKSPLPSIQDMAKFYQRVAAVPTAMFLDTAKSFSVDSEIRRTDALIKTFRADSTPTIIVNGKYRLEPRSAGGTQQAVDLTLSLAR
ncbi:MAG: thiol:disulfide interchange protein DsbA/DsbL [Pseudomonadota bacterium]